MKEAGVRISETPLRIFSTAILVAAGFEQESAEETARLLVWANLRGADSHGVLRIPRYVELVRSGGINPRPNMRVEKRAGAIVVLEADRAPGAAAMSRAMEEAIARARSVHVGWCAARNITHAGTVGYFALQAAKAGMAGIVMTASRPMMAYYGARMSGVSTNPLAIAVPGGSHAPLVLDMSTATVAMGKIMAARDAGSAIPVGWGIDEEGRDTTDPHRVATLLPVGGAKGSGLSLMIECLASLTVANPILSLALSPSGIPGGTRLNGIAIAVDLAVFGDPDGFRAEVDQLSAAISALPAASGYESVLLPGERGDGVKARREAEGIPLPQGTWRRLVAIADELGVDVPTEAG